MRRLPSYGSLLFLAAVALLAPALALDRPFLLHVAPEGAGSGFGALPGGWSAPWLSGLFDLRVFPSVVDRFCNALLLTTPLLALLRRFGRGRVLAAWALCGAAVLAGASHRGPSIDYQRRIERLRGRGVQVLALFPPVRHGPFRTDVSRVDADPGAEHPLGTDGAGRDVLARMIFGARTSLAIAFVAVSLSVSIGVLLGALAGYFRGAAERAVLLLVEATACFPTFLLVMVLICLVRERSLLHVMAVIGLTGWPTVARLVRAEFLARSGQEHVLAARALGVSELRIVWRHVLPHCLTPVFVAAAFGIAGAILVESGLAFLGLGDPDAASWGQILAEGRQSGRLLLLLVPSAALFLTVSVVHGFGERLRDALDLRRAEVRT